MEINITQFVATECATDYTASIADIGPNAGIFTWQAAKEHATESPMLDTDEKREAFKSWVKNAGAWTDEEIAAWSNQELDALFIQWVSGDMRECDITADGTDWAEVEARQSEGNAPSNIYRADDGQIYFSLSN